MEYNLIGKDLIDLLGGGDEKGVIRRFCNLV